MANSKEEVKTRESANPSTDKGNYIIQVKAEGGVVKQTVALNATVQIIDIGDSPAAFDVH